MLEDGSRRRRSGVDWCSEPAPEHDPGQRQAPVTAARSARRRILDGRWPPSPTPSCRRGRMDVLYERCAGLDVHKKTVVACVLSPGEGAEPRRETRTFSTMTVGLEGLRDWLHEQGCSHVALEATGAYWKPIYNVLEGHLTVLVVN